MGLGDVLSQIILTLLQLNALQLYSLDCPPVGCHLFFGFQHLTTADPCYLCPHIHPLELLHEILNSVFQNTARRTYVHIWLICEPSNKSGIVFDFSAAVLSADLPKQEEAASAGEEALESPSFGSPTPDEDEEVQQSRHDQRASSSKQLSTIEADVQS